MASLVCYPLVFAVEGAIVPGHGLGAVATRPDARKRGFATELCRHAIAGAVADGRRIGLLYSAIPPAFYERLGYRVAPAWRPSCTTRLAELAASGPHVAWTPLDPRREAATLAALYERHHRGVHLHRDEAGYLRSIDLNVRDTFFGLGQPLEGYVRLAIEDGWVELVEDVVPERDRAAALRTVARLAVDLASKGVEGWFDPCPEVSLVLRGPRSRHDAAHAARGRGRGGRSVPRLGLLLTGIGGPRRPRNPPSRSCEARLSRPRAPSSIDQFETMRGVTNPSKMSTVWNSMAPVDQKIVTS